ncbi:MULTISPECIES: hypothetical protein [Paraburkholderia]|uniref:Uncharacterized protein n=1 Tax=Paraburkholderia podalyriae TaxID=1938811 RepID=A0ABR7PG08_9BURK|nr:hypothetical protein [Paraburkholderia podalyriae]MBC8745210.1 hypothetical protein [Paraburkholderia podalyriae]
MSAAERTADMEHASRVRDRLQYATSEELARFTDEEIGIVIAHVEAEYPQLTHAGWIESGLPRPASAASHPAYQKYVRTALLFVRAHAMPQEAVNSAANSVQLARIASSWGARNVGKGRVPNGAFIVAAIIAGYTPVRYPGSGPSCSFNMRFDVGAWLYDMAVRELVAELAEAFALSR